MRVCIQTKIIFSVALCVAFGSSFFLSASLAESKDSTVGSLKYIGGYPTKETAQKLYDELDSQRAVEANLWALLMASYGDMADAHYKLGAGDHAVVVIDNSAEPQHLALTANHDTIYMCAAVQRTR